MTHAVQNYQDAARIDGELGYRFIRACFDRGVYFHNYGRWPWGTMASPPPTRRPTSTRPDPGGERAEGDEDIIIEREASIG